MHTVTNISVFPASVPTAKHAHQQDNCFTKVATWFTHMVGTYSPGNEFVVYEMSIQVFPTEPSPTTTHLMSLSAFAISEERKCYDYKSSTRE